MKHATITDRPDCDHCRAALQQRAEQDRLEYLAKLDAAYASIFDGLVHVDTLATLFAERVGKAGVTG